MLSRCPLVSPKRRSFFFVRFLVQRAIFSLSFYFFKMYISPLCPILYKNHIFSHRFIQSKTTHFHSLYLLFKRIVCFPSLFRFVEGYTFLFFIPFRQKIIRFPSRSFYQRVIRFFFPRGSRNVLLFVSSPFLASARSVSRAKALYSAFQTLVGCAFPPFPRLSSDTRFFRFYAPRRPGREPFASVSSLAYPLPLPALRAFFPAVFPFPAPVVSRLSVPAPIKNRAGA